MRALVVVLALMVAFLLALMLLPLFFGGSVLDDGSSAGASFRDLSAVS
jgi:hypothetical protein